MEQNNTPMQPKAPKPTWFRVFDVEIFKPNFDEITAASVGATFLWAISVSIFYLLNWNIDVRLASFLLVWCFWSSVSAHMGLKLGPLASTWRIWVVYGFIGLHLLLAFELVWFVFFAPAPTP